MNVQSKPTRHELPVVLVDMDNTLCDFANPLYRELRSRHGNLIPPVEEWTDWEFWKSLIEPKQFHTAVNTVQNTPSLWEPLPGATELLYRLRRNYYVIIASHRVNTADVNIKLMDWLFRNDMPYHQIHLSFDKTVLLPQASLIIDDSPTVLSKASAYFQDRDKVYGLRLPWNSHLDTNEHVRLVNSLSNIGV